MKNPSGFTLIEMSIVLVIIGLIVGGVLVGKDLIAAAEIRSQISQIREFNLAVRTFQNKYQCLPGDCAKGESFGFAARGPYDGQGDGNGVIEGSDEPSPGYSNGFEIAGEIILFWGDLTLSGLIAGPNPDVAYDYSICAGRADLLATCGGSTGSLDQYFPKAKLAGGNYITVWSGGWGNDSGSGLGTGSSAFEETYVAGNKINYFALNFIDYVASTEIYNRSGIKVSQAYVIDNKIDDGLPQTGKVIAMHPNMAVYYAILGGYIQYASGGNPPTVFGVEDTYTTIGEDDTDATEPTENTCFDNGDVDGETQRYSMGVNQGNGVNCALSFQFE